MRILFVINTMGRGGAEVQVRDVALRLAARGHAVGVVVMLPYEDFEAQLKGGGVHTASLHMKKGTPSMQAILELRREVRRFAPDVVHSHLFAANILARLGVGIRSRRRPLIVNTAHARYERAHARYVAYRSTNHWCDLFTCVSRRGIEVLETHNAAAKGKIEYTPNGIAFAEFRRDPTIRASTRRTLGVADDSFLWLAIGSFRDEDKDYDTMLRAFAQARDERSRLFIAGEGKLLEQKQAMVRSLDLDESATLLGLRSDVPALLAAADAFVLSSKSEGMPIVLLEAAAAGLPMVATSVGDVDQIVVDGMTGFLCPAGSPPALAAAMVRLSRLDPHERQTFGLRALAHVKALYDLESVVARWEKLYEVALEGHQASTRP